MMFKNMLILSVFLFNYACCGMERWDGKSNGTVPELSRDSSMLTKATRADGQPDLAELIALEQGLVPVDNEDQRFSEFVQSIRDRVPALDFISDAMLRDLQKTSVPAAQLIEQLRALPMAKRGIHGIQIPDSNTLSFQLLTLLVQEMAESNNIQKRKIEEHKKTSDQALEEGRRANELASEANELAIQTRNSAAADSVKNTQIQKKQFWLTTAIAVVGLIVTGALSITSLVSTYSMGHNSTGP